MFDIGWSEMLVIAIVIIVVVGPKELPGMLRTFGRTTSKLRVMANDFRKQFDEALKEAELDDVRKLADDVRSLNPANQVRDALSPVQKAVQDVKAGLDSALNPLSTPAPAKVDDKTTPSEALADKPVSSASADVPASEPAVAEPAKPDETNKTGGAAS